MSDAGAPMPAGSILAVFAHPDDESLACGATLAWCARLGMRVTLLCATRGEYGGLSDGHRRESGSLTGGKADGQVPVTPDRTASIRTRELTAAAQTLGIADLLWLDHEDGMLPWIDPARLEGDVAAVIRRVRPDVAITFDADGLYWHPDHIALHERTTAAVAGLGRDAPALYYASLPPGQIRTIVDVVGARTGSGMPHRVLGIADPDAFGADAPAPTLVLDVGAFAGRKLAALRCHRSQVAGEALDRLTDDEAGRLLVTEQFRRAPVGAPGETLLDRLRHARIPD